MFIIECLPFRKGLNKEYLSYFSSSNLKSGSLIKVPIRGKETHALVIRSREAVDAKSEIRSASFLVKKIISFSAKPFLKKEFLDAVKETSDFYAASQGAILSHLLPGFVSENPKMISENYNPELRSINADPKNIQPSLIQCEEEERFTDYKSLIREEFARGKSVFVCLPHNEAILHAKEKLERGVENYVATFWKDMTKKEFKTEWKKSLNHKHPVVIIGTARWLFLPRDDFGTIVIEKENDNGWKTLARPFFDLRFFVEKFAKNLGSKIVFGDSCARIETLHRYKEGEITAYENVKWRISGSVPVKIVDMKKQEKSDEFKCLSKELYNLVSETHKSGNQLFIYASRKGLSSVTVCRDCGELVKCSNCSSPMVLYNKGVKGAIFRCHQCGEVRDAAEYCKNCKSWKLASFGCGIDKVVDEIKKNFDGTVFELNKDTAPTGIKASTIVKKFMDTKGSILVGTEMAFPYLTKKISHIAISSLDSLFAIPDFRIHEKIFRIILQCSAIAKKTFILQSRNTEEHTIKYGAEGNILKFYLKEIEDRKYLNYPPFGTFIKVSFRGSRSQVEKETQNLSRIFEAYGAAVFPSAQEKRGEQAAVNAVIKLKKEEWPSQNVSDTGGSFYGLNSTLSSLPPSYEIKIDPDTLL